jgi:CheY-like chemotaxis protein
VATRVLYVDDEPDIRDIAVLSLGLDPSFEVRACESGQDAVETIGGWQPDVALLDVMMPDMDGPTTLARLRETQAGAKLPVIFITALSQSHEIEPLLALGAIGVIRKPFDPMSLAGAVSAHLNTSRGRG